MADDLDKPFKAEYAKSGRASCTQCKGTITKDTLRMAKMVQVNSYFSHNFFIVFTSPVSKELFYLYR